LSEKLFWGGNSYINPLYCCLKNFFGGAILINPMPNPGPGVPGCLFMWNLILNSESILLLA